ncbi:hypothetical protein V6N13_139749 [Hibiscus sabdariffa]|uniref:Uncharacterized protein n=2 Tax=Hibiscus sabdariffa TaxID=183260 RepID=A0ABR1ZC04_9ROSI
MEGHGYAYRASYKTYNGGAVPRGGADGWSKTSYDSDHNFQPVFIDSTGRRKPAMSYPTPNGNTGYYGAKTEVVEVPTYVAEYKQSTPVRVDMVRDYGNVDSKLISRPLSPENRRKSSSPVRYHAEEKWNRPSSPVRYHVEEKWAKPSSPARYHTEEKWINQPWSAVLERPQQVEDFVTKVQTQASRPNKFSPLSATHWRQSPTVTTETGGGSWSKPSHGVYNLSQPTSDIGTAMEYLKESVKPPPPFYGHSNMIRTTANR